MTDPVDAIDVCVVGSANQDLILDVVRIPAPGETVLAGAQASAAGGKGLNQAVAAARAGARVVFVAAMGSDAAADLLRATLTGAGVAIDLLRSVAAPTGSAVVVRAADGENAIVVAPGANDTLTGLDESERAAIGRSRVVLCQQEIPAAAVHAAVTAGAAAGAVVIVNAAPAVRLAADVLDRVAVLVVNEHELAAQLVDATDPAVAAEADPATAAAAAEPATAADAETDPVRVAAAAWSLVTAQRSVVITLGGRGAVCVERAGATHVPATAAEQVVDTTGAGDAFCGALAAALARGVPLVRAAQYGCAAGSLAVRGFGAAPSMAGAAEIERCMAQAPEPRRIGPGGAS